jgi:hypothetical protein
MDNMYVKNSLIILKNIYGPISNLKPASIVTFAALSTLISIALHKPSDPVIVG